MCQSRRAAYTSGKVPLSLFKVVWLRWSATQWYAGAGLVPLICLDPMHLQLSNTSSPVPTPYFSSLSVSVGYSLMKVSVEKCLK